MKKSVSWIVLSLLMVAASAEAKLNSSLGGKRPASIECEPMVAVQDLSTHVVIEDFNTQAPKNNLDANHVSLFRGNTVTTEYCTSNECDNHYCFVFFNADMTGLARGQLAQMVGSMRYYNADSVEREARTIPIVCRKR